MTLDAGHGLLISAFRRSLLVLVALRLCANAGTAQESRIRVDTTLVTVPIVATDANGRPIRDLRRDELTITDDGVPQEIKYLWTELDLPLTAGLVIDVSSSELGFVRAHLNSAERFVTRVAGPGDRVLLATVDEQPRLLVDLTTSRDEILRGIELIRQNHHAGRLIGEPCQPPSRVAHRGTKACIGTAIWDGVFHVTRSDLEPAEGRKALVLLSDGLDLHSSVHELSSAIEAAQSADVAVYTIKHLSAAYLALSPLLIRAAARDHGMERIAEQTGGLAFNHPKAPDAIYNQIEEDLRSQCILAYTPKAPGVQGKWHHLEVRTTRPAVRVRAKAGYRVP